MANWTQEEIKKTLELSRNKAITDVDFRKKLLNDPAAAIKELTGKDAPDGLKLQILERDSHANAVMVLPPIASGEMSDDELSKVAAADGTTCYGYKDNCRDYICL